jgi:SNF2 family DNA or RNA helicase
VSSFRLARSSRASLRLLVPSGLEADILAHPALVVPGVTATELGNRVELSVTALDVPSVQNLLEQADLLGELSKFIRFGNPTLTVVPKRSLMVHQVPAVESILAAHSYGGFLLADDMGLGKTTSALLAAVELAKRERAAICICAPLFARGTWLRELQTVLGVSRDQICVLEGVDSQAAGKWNPNAQWYFCHYDIAFAWWSKFNLQTRPRIMILDEAHALKNWNAKRSKGAALMSALSSFRIVLSGTPLDNKPSDLWNILQLATGAGSWGTLTKFRQRYCGAVFNSYGYQDTVPTHVDELQLRLQNIYMRRDASSANLKLPEMLRQCMPTGSLSEDAVAQQALLLGRANLSAVIDALLRGGVQDVLPVLTKLFQITAKAKLPTTIGYVNSLLERGERVVVFCNERKTANALGKALKSSVVVTGEHSPEERDHAVQTFQARKTECAFITTYGVMRENVTLHNARTVVMHDLHWVLNYILQAEKRIHRIGQNHTCQSVWMVAERSIDTILAPILQRKANAAKDIFGMYDAADFLDAAQFPVLSGEDSIGQQLKQAFDNWVL